LDFSQILQEKLSKVVWAHVERKNVNDRSLDNRSLEPSCILSPSAILPRSVRDATGQSRVSLALPSNPRLEGALLSLVILACALFQGLTAAATAILVSFYSFRWICRKVVEECDPSFR
jgi:hypothetical protein